MNQKQAALRRTPSQDGITCRVEQITHKIVQLFAVFFPNIALGGYSISDLTNDFSNEEVIKKFAEILRWGNHRRCPRCNSTRTKTTPNGKPMPYYCGDCRKAGRPKTFSVLTGTHLESLGMSWTKVLHVIYFLAAQHEGISASQMAEYAGIDRTTALDLRRKVHVALPDEVCHHFAGPTEVDESYLGGSESKKHKQDRENTRGRQGKKCVLGAVDRTTRHVRLLQVEKADYPTIKAFVHSAATLGSGVYTDGLRVYRRLKARFQHEWVEHGDGEYGKGDVNTNSVEELFDRLDRSLFPLRGVREEHLQGYLVEIQWLRNLSDQPVLVRMAVLLAYLLRVETLTTSSGASGAESVADESRGQRTRADDDDRTPSHNGMVPRKVVGPSSAKSAATQPRQKKDGGGKGLPKPRAPKKHHPLQGVLPACWD